MRAVALALALGFVAGCIDQDPAGTPLPGDVGPRPETLEFRLKPSHLLSELPAASQAPQKVYAAPTANAYVNEDVEVFTSAPLARGLHVHSVALEIHYAADRTTIDAMGNDSDPSETTHFVFWVGSGGIYPVYNSRFGPAVIEGGTHYSGTIGFVLPGGGWHIPAGEPLQLLVAPLAVQAGPANLHYLVDHATADSRITLNATEWAPPTLDEPQRTDEVVNVAGNSGAFTSLAPPEISTVERPITLEASDAFLEIRVEFQSTKGAKSDLDLMLLDGAGSQVAASTTPYQSETIRLYGEAVASLGTAPLTIHVNAYSGADTTFRLVTARAGLG